jgi:hypothetical protein
MGLPTKEKAMRHTGETIRGGFSGDELVLELVTMEGGEAVLYLTAWDDTERVSMTVELDHEGLQSLALQATLLLGHLEQAGGQDAAPPVTMGSREGPR